MEVFFTYASVTQDLRLVQRTLPSLCVNRSKWPRRSLPITTIFLKAKKSLSKLRNVVRSRIHFVPLIQPLPRHQVINRPATHPHSTINPLTIKVLRLVAHDEVEEEEEAAAAAEELVAATEEEQDQSNDSCCADHIY